MMNEEMKLAVARAVEAAIKEIGLDTFKRTSFFMSNRHQDNLKSAA